MGIQPRNDGRRYEAVLRLGEALSLCSDPEDLTKVLSELLREFLDFLQFYIIVYKEKSSEVEWAVVGQEKSLMAAYADVPIEQRPSWQAYTTQEAFHIRDWNSDERVPGRLKHGIAAQGLDVGPLVFVPLTTPHRRLGALGMSGAPGIVYSTDDVSFLRLVGRVVAFAIDDNFNLRRAEVAQRELQSQNERLQRSERELREVIETIPSMAWAAAPDGAAEFFNGRWLAYAGLTADEAQGWGWTVAVHPDDLKQLIDYWRTVMASGQSGEIEARLRRFDGVYRWFLFRATASLDGNGKPVKWYGTNTDIEERKRAEDALKRSEAYLAEAQKLSRTGSFGWDVSSGEIYWSRETFRIFEYEPTAQVSVDQIVQRTHPEDRLAVQQLIERVSRERKEWDFEHRLLMPDGSVKYLRVVGHPSHGESGKFEFVGAVTDVTEQKGAEEELRRSEENHRVVVETASDVVISMDESGLILLANPATKMVFGYDSVELIGKPMTTLMPEFMRNLHETGLRRYLATGQRHMNWQGTELIGLRKNGEEFPLEVSFGEQIRNGHRVFTGFIRDISEKKKADESLRRTESYLAEAQRLAHIGSWAWELPSREALYISEEWYRIYGFDPKDGMPDWEQRLQRIHPEDRGGFQAAIDRAIAEEFDYDVEFRILPPHSPGRYIHSVGHPVLSPSGELLQFVGVSMDITESKQAEDAFRLIVVGTAATTGSDFFQSLVQHMAQALRARYAFVTTCDDHKHARTLSFWKGDGFGENFEFDIADTPCEKVLRGEICHYRQGLRGLFPLDKILADWQAESYLGVPMLDGSNRVIGHIAILDDRPMEADLRAIDLLKIFASRAAAELKRQRAEDELHGALQERERLRRAQAELARINRVSTMGELTASLAHEIKQPIGAAVTNAEASLRLLNRDHPDLAEAREAALEMVKDARRAANIIDRVRSLYQKGSSTLDAVDVNEVIGEMMVMLQNEAKRHSVRIRTDLAAGLPAVMADRVQLQQVLMNLMLNGIEAMRDAGGELSIKSQLAEDGQLLISVTDQGVGLPTENPDQIFNPFFTTKSQGTGLGLAITRSIVEAHGGRIWASTNSGRGATFYFTLPSRVPVAA